MPKPRLPVNPATELAAAQAEGLLRIRGVTADDRHDVTIGLLDGTDARVRWHPEQVGPAVATLRTSRDLLRIVAADDVGISFAVPGRPEDSHSMAIAWGNGPHWTAGYRAGARRGGRPHAGRDTGAALATLLNDPSLGDMLRMRLLAAMEEQGVSRRELAERINKAQKTVTVALQWGAWLSLETAEQMAAALGRRWLVALGTTGGADPFGATEPAALGMLRNLFICREHGWLRYLGPAAPAQALRVNSITVSVGATRYEVSAAHLAAWALGLAWAAASAPVPTSKRGRKAPA